MERAACDCEMGRGQEKRDTVCGITGGRGTLHRQRSIEGGRTFGARGAAGRAGFIRGGGKEENRNKVHTQKGPPKNELKR